MSCHVRVVVRRGCRDCRSAHTVAIHDEAQINIVIGGFDPTVGAGSGRHAAASEASDSALVCRLGACLSSRRKAAPGRQGGVPVQTNVLRLFNSSRPKIRSCARIGPDLQTPTLLYQRCSDGYCRSCPLMRVSEGFSPKYGFTSKSNSGIRYVDQMRFQL